MKHRRGGDGFGRDWERRRVGEPPKGPASEDPRNFAHSRVEPMADAPPRRRLLEELKYQLRLRHRSLSTERSYIDWVRRFVLFHGKRHPAALGKDEIEAFLGHLAMDRGVSASTQNQALNALVFLYRYVIGRPIGELTGLVRAKRSENLPVVLSTAEMSRVLDRLDGDPWLVSMLLWGSGLRLMEALRLRIKDVDFERRELRIRDGKGRKSRVTVLPERAAETLRARIASTLAIHATDLVEGFGEVEMPLALAKKFPHAGHSPKWQFVFCADRRSACPRTGRIGRHHVFPTTMIYTHVLNRGGRGVFSPADVSHPAPGGPATRR